MVAKGGGDIIAQAIISRIIAAHNALQFGEFINHAGGQIGFTQCGGAFGGGRIGR
jgi:hypothetical protein